jgi:hypothetical protein
LCDGAVASRAYRKGYADAYSKTATTVFGNEEGPIV